MKPAVTKCVATLKDSLSFQYQSLLKRGDRYAQDDMLDDLQEYIRKYNAGDYTITVYRPKRTRVSTMEEAVEYLKNNLPENVVAITSLLYYRSDGNKDYKFSARVTMPHLNYFLNLEAAVRKAESVLAIRDEHEVRVNNRFDLYDKMQTNVRAACDAAVDVALMLRVDGDNEKELRRRISTLGGQLTRDISHTNLNTDDTDLKYLYESACHLRDSMYTGRREIDQPLYSYRKIASDAIESVSSYRQSLKGLTKAWNKLHEAMDEADAFETRIRKELSYGSGTVCIS